MASGSIKQFFTSTAYAVVGASTRRTKFGSKVLRCYLQHEKKVYPVNPREKKIENLVCINHIKDLPSDVMSISIVTPPAITVKVIEEAIRHGIKNIWLQPGAESLLAIQRCEEHNVNLIAEGPCILEILGFRE